MIDKNLKNLFIVRTPLQVINAIEAVNHFNLINNTIVVIKNKATKQMEKLIDLYRWNEIISIDAQKGKMSYFDYINTVNNLKKYKYNYIFFARFGSIQRLIISNTQKNKVYYFDDGTDTITMYNNMLIPNKINQLNFRQLARIRFLFNGLKINIKDNINLFTYFNLKELRNTEVVLNKLSFFQVKYLSNSKEEDSLYILGQPLSEKKFVNENVYIEYIKKVISSVDKKIIYIPHGGESQSTKINALVSGDFKILNIDTPIEFYFLQNNIKPTHVVSFFTTAFFTLKLFYPKSIFEKIYISEKHILKKQNDIKIHYDFLDELGVANILLDGENEKY